MAARSSGHSRSEGPSPRTYGARTAQARTARAGSRPSPPAPAHRRSPGAAAGAQPSAPAATRTRRRPGTPSSEDVGAKATGLDDGDPASANAHDPGPLQRGEEPADALARGPGELGEVRLRHVDRLSDPALYLLHSPLIAVAVIECLIAIWAAESRAHWLWRWLA